MEEKKEGTPYISSTSTSLVDDSYNSIPNAETLQAIEELESGGGTHCKNLKEFYKSLA